MRKETLYIYPYGHAHWHFIYIYVSDLMTMCVMKKKKNIYVSDLIAMCAMKYGFLMEKMSHDMAE